MITSLEIENVRGIAHGKLEDLSPLTILVGPNGSGKSTILDALLIGAHPQPGVAIGLTTSRHAGLRDPLAWLRRASAGISPSRIMTATAEPEYHREVILEKNDDWTVAISLVANSQKMISHVNWQSTDAVPFPGVPGATIIGVMPATQTELVQTFSALKPTGKLAEITATVQALLPGATRLELLADRENIPYLSIEYPTGNVPVAMSGDGIHALIRLGLDLAVQSGGIALVEEPEVHLHPAGLMQAAKLIWSTVRRGVQVVLTTHSLEFIDALLDSATEPDDLAKLSLFWVKLNQGELTTIRIPGDDVAFEREKIGKDLR